MLLENTNTGGAIVLSIIVALVVGSLISIADSLKRIAKRLEK